MSLFRLNETNTRLSQILKTMFIKNNNDEKKMKKAQMIQFPLELQRSKKKCL